MTLFYENILSPDYIDAICVALQHSIVNTIRVDNHSRKANNFTVDISQHYYDGVITPSNYSGRDVSSEGENLKEALSNLGEIIFKNFEKIISDDEFPQFRRLMYKLFYADGGMRNNLRFIDCSKNSGFRPPISLSRRFLCVMEVDLPDIKHEHLSNGSVRFHGDTPYSAIKNLDEFIESEYKCLHIISQ
jgi:hypothetical protein